MIMKKETLLKLIAEKGYIISYAANLNFATYDIVTGLPPRVSYISLAVAVIGLIWTGINTCWITVPILLLSIACIYTEKYLANIEEYAKRGVANTNQWNELKRMYYQVKDSTDDSLDEEVMKRLQQIEEKFNSTAEYNQVLFANWYAHYKLFAEKDYHWMDEQLKFDFWKDKLPRSFTVILLLLLLSTIITFCVNCPVISGWFVSLFDFCNK